MVATEMDETESMLVELQPTLAQKRSWGSSDTNNQRSLPCIGSELKIAGWCDYKWVFSEENAWASERRTRFRAGKNAYKMQKMKPEKILIKKDLWIKAKNGL